MKRQALPVRGLVFIALLAALGIAAKPVLGPLVHLLTSYLFIPGGVVAGGVYMMFLVLAAALNCKGTAGRIPFAATFTSIVQALIVMTTGLFGFHGIMSIMTYTAPGLAVDLVFLAFSLRKSESLSFPCFFGGFAANLAGAYAVNLVFFSLPVLPLLLSLFVAALSGGVGGVTASMIHAHLKKLSLVGGK